MGTDKKILIISNEPLSNTSSNGRTLRNFLLGIPKEQLAQFYIHGDPDKEICSNYYQVSDRDALNSLIPQNKKSMPSNDEDISKLTKENKIKKNCRTMVIRDIVWRCYRWWDTTFDKFIEDFSPNVILFQAGDAPFMYDITLRIAQKYNLPIVMYNSEEYVLKEKMYNGAAKNSLWHKCLQSSLRSIYKKMMNSVRYCIYSTEYLEDKYQKIYPHPGKSCTLYTVSELDPLSDNSDQNHFNLLYCGNLGVGRVYPLDEIAKILYEIDKSATLDIYGTFADKKDEIMLCSNPNVSYGGVVSYERVLELISQASMLIHCENIDRLENLRGAFSTKIADCLASGRPFLVYASDEYPFVQYLQKHDCAHIAKDNESLRSILKRCISDIRYRELYINNARQLAIEKHSLDKNCLSIKEIMTNL